MAARSLAWTCGALALLGLQLGAAQPLEKRPNILILLADDLGWNDVGWRNPGARTPNLDCLRRESLALEQHYVASMCTPTRASLLTGRFPSRFGLSVAENERALRFDTMTLPRALQQSGYATALVGKWHLGSAPEWGPQHFGFDSSYGVLAGGCGPYSHRYKAGPYTQTWHRDGRLFEEEGHVTDLLAREAVSWLEKRDDRPFFLYVAFTAPHVPIREPARWLEANAHVADPAKREFYASVTHMDHAVGEIMAALDRSGKREQTLVLFFSDNGAIPDQRNETWLTSPDPRDRYTPGTAGGDNRPLRGKKTTVYEGGVRVPAFVHWRGRIALGQFHGVMHVADWMPTLLGVTGSTPRADLRWDGADMWPALAGRQPAPARELYWVSARWSDSAVRDGDWKLIVTHAGDRAQLFDLQQDPGEAADLAGAQPERVAAMRRLMRELAANDKDAEASSDRASPPTGPR